MQRTFSPHVAAGRTLVPAPGGGRLLDRSDRESALALRALESKLERERERADALEARATLLGDALESMAAGVVVYDASLQILAWNRHFTEMLGIDAALMKPGVSVEDIVRFQLAHGEYGEGDEEQLVRERLRIASRPDLDIEYVRPNGTRLQIRGTPMSGGRIVGIFTDVTALRLAEEAERREALILDQMFDAVIITSEQGRIRDWNKAAERMFGWARDEALGRLGNFLLADASPEMDRLILEMLARNDSQALELAFQRRDGSRGIAEVVFARLYDDRDVTRAAIAVGRDVTRRKQIELELAHAQRIEAVGQLTGGIAHDFNNLLTVILGGAELLVQGSEEPAVAAEIAQEILSVARTAASLTQRLLAFSRKQTLDPRALDLGALLRDLATILRRTLGETIALVVKLDPELPPVFADAAQLESALVNLAVNARDAMPRGGRLVVSARRALARGVDAAAGWRRRHGRYVEIAVTDEGTGMSPEVRAKAVEPFFTTKDPGRGTGLGLSQVYGFVRQSGGDLLIESHVGRGTRVRLRLPVASRPARARPIPPVAAVRGGGETILVVEDAPAVRRYVVRSLRALGYRALEAADGPGALATLATSETIDLLLTDITLPGGLLGLELATEARRQRPSLRVLCMTGHADELTARRGADSPPILAKPFGREALAKAIRSALDDAGAGDRR